MHTAWSQWNASPPPAPAVLRRPVGKLPERALLVNGVRHVGQRSGKGEREGTACAGNTAAAPHFKDRAPHMAPVFSLWLSGCPQ